LNGAGGNNLGLFGVDERSALEIDFVFMAAIVAWKGIINGRPAGKKRPVFLAGLLHL
jgi:hypothetical protein